MNLITNEFEYAQEVLKNKDIEKDTIKKIIVLVKYYKELDMNREQIYSEIEDFMTNNYPNYNKAMWQDTIQSFVVKFSKPKYKLRKIESIQITKGEMEFILSQNNDKMQRVLFIMLVYAKLGKSNGWVNSDTKYIFKDSDCRDTSKNQYLYMNKLYNLGFVEFPKSIKNSSFRITYLNEDEEVAIDMKDFRNPIMYYYEYINPNSITKCGICGEKILKIGKNLKYCSKCSATIRRDYKAKKQREYREK